jgi:DNA-binding response OmpR family regulator
MAEDILKAALDSTDILILSNDPNIRYLFENTGFRHIQTVRTEAQHALNIIAKEQCDLIVIDDLFYGDDTADFVKRLRNGEFSENIFLPVITLISEATSETANSMIRVGSDDVVIKPLSVNDIKKRIKTLVNRKIQYVVTADYVGPNRRSAARTDPDKDNLIEIPNALKSKADGYLASKKDISEQMRDAHKQVRDRRLSLDGSEIQSLINSALLSPEDFQIGIRKIEPLAREFETKLSGTGHKHIGEMCGMLNNVIEKIRGFEDKDNIELLVLLGNAISLAFKDDEASRQSSREVVVLIKQKFRT